MERTQLVPPNTTLSLEVTENNVFNRIDRYISRQFPFYSRNFFQRLIDDELISINGKTVSKPNTPVKPHDIIVVKFPPERKIEPATISSTIAIKQLNIEVLYEHPHFLIIHKPAHLLVHSPFIASSAITLVDWLLLTYQELTGIGYADRPGIIHRLDKDTSGLLIIPRTNYAYQVFGSLFKKRAIQKTYYAIVQGHPEPSGSIDLPIGRDPHNRKKMAAFSQKFHLDSSEKLEDIYQPIHRDGHKIRYALTHYKVLEYFDNCSLVEVKPVTGRTHQIRVHFSAIGHPLIGDPIYNSKSKDIKRQALHAYALSFEFEGEQFSFSKEPPDDFKKLCETLR